MLLQWGTGVVVSRVFAYKYSDQARRLSNRPSKGVHRKNDRVGFRSAIALTLFVVDVRSWASKNGERVHGTRYSLSQTSNLKRIVIYESASDGAQRPRSGMR